MDGLSKLLAANKDVIGGIYNMKRLPLTSTIKLAESDGTMSSVQSAENVQLDKPFRVYGVPTGFMLIRLKAIEMMDYPFDFWRKPKEERFTDDIEGLVGEDIYFCEQCRLNGIEVWCDPTIRIGHIGEYVY
jgi:hypothetical protein